MGVVASAADIGSGRMGHMLNVVLWGTGIQ